MSAAAHRRGDKAIRGQITDALKIHDGKWDVVGWQNKAAYAEERLAAEREELRRARLCIERLRAYRTVDQDTIAELRRTVQHKQDFISGLIRDLTTARKIGGRWERIVRDCLTSDRVQAWYADNPEEGQQQP